MSDEAQRQRKRERDESFDTTEQPRTAKKRKAGTSSRYPPEFWDTLSKVYLTRNALKELDRRTKRDKPLPAPNARKPPATRRILRSDSRTLDQIAKHGGADLSALRGYSDLPVTANNMSQPSSSSLKRSRGAGAGQSGTPNKTKTASPYDGNFEQKMLDTGIYPMRYRTTDGRLPPPPKNIEEIREVLRRPRSSLSPSVFPEAAFEDFLDSNTQATSEVDTVANVIPFVTGTEDRHYRPTGGYPFNNMEKFDPNVSLPKPDVSYGASVAQIDPRVRDDLHRYIVPSTNTSRPVAPNFFRADKGGSGTPPVVRRQAMYDGAVGARGMWHLQNYGNGNTTPVYDGNAYTITSTYHYGHLHIYTTHPSPPSEAGGNSQYYMNQLASYSITGDINTFRDGVGAYRNAREWTKEKRDQFITDANAVARRTSTETRSFSRSAEDTHDSAVVEAADEPSSSDTSMDELALDYDALAKRQRRSTTR